MKQILVVVDMQNDFISGSLGTKEAINAVPHALALIESKKWDKIIATYDTHHGNYLNTQEGKNLPVIHCIEGTKGWELEENILSAITAAAPCEKILKEQFGSLDIIGKIAESGDEIEVTLCGVCTDICVISNAMIIKSAFPEAKVNVAKDACAGVTPEKHNAALDVLQSCQINII